MEFRRHALRVPFHYNLARKGVNVDAAPAKDVNPMMSVEYSAIWPCFQAVSLSERQGVLQDIR